MSYSKDGINSMSGRPDSSFGSTVAELNIQSIDQASDASTRRSLVSIMIPCFNEEESLRKEIPEFIDSLADDPDFDFELLLIDDFSEDQTPQILAELCQQHANVRAIRLGRNCGSHMAYRAGMDYCSGDAIAFTVADLQEGIDLIRQSLQLWKAGASVIGTVAIGRDRGGLLNETGARLFYWLRRNLGQSPSSEANEAAVRVIDRTVVEHCRRFAPRTRNLNTWIFSQPFSMQFLRYTPTQRRYGKSKWTFRKKLRLVIDTLLDTSTAILTVWLVLGVGLIATALIVLALGFVQSFSSDVGNTNWLLQMLLGTIIGCTGLTLLAAGSIGIYVWRILEELRGGPGYSAQPLGGFSGQSQRTITRNDAAETVKFPHGPANQRKDVAFG